MGAARALLSALLRPFGYKVVRTHHFDRALDALGADPWRDLVLAPERVEAALASARDPWTYRSDGLATIHNSGFLRERRFVEAYARGVAAADGRDDRWYWRVHVGLWAAGTALRRKGDFVECGVNYGCLSSAIMHRHDWRVQDRRFWLLDTFAGIDADLVPDAARGAQTARTAANLRSGRYVSGVERVRANFAEWPRVEIVVGTVPGTLGRIDSDAIAFLHLDMNNPVPEAAALRHLWPRLSPGGVVLLDDYAYHGADDQRAAIDAVAAELGFEVARLPTGQGLAVR